MFSFDPRNVGEEIIFPGGMRFQLVETADKSLTARLAGGPEPSETMHSLRGAFSETVYIYGKAYENACSLLDQIHLKKNQLTHTVSPRVFSLGLGLGYVELLSSALSIRNNRDLRGASYEAVPELNQSFLGWLGLAPAGFVPAIVYENILNRTAQETHLHTDDIRDNLRQAIELEKWKIKGPLTITSIADRNDDENETFNCIAFDAFSSKSTPELWTRHFLDQYLLNYCDKTCVLSTYACTGHLKRALIAAGFKLEIREGYASKRDSTLAYRLESAQRNND